MTLSVRQPAFRIRTDGTDTWDALQALLDLAGSREIVDFDDGRFCVSKPLRLSIGGRYTGSWRPGSQTNGTVIEALGPTNVIEMPPLVESQTAAVFMDGFTLYKGADQFNAPNGADWLTLRNMAFVAASNRCLYARGFLQNWNLENIEFRGGQYGFYLPLEAGRDGGSQIVLDKSKFTNCGSSGQLKNGWYITPKLSNSVSWTDLKIRTAKEDGFVLGGGIRMWSFTTVNTEGNGWMGSPKPANAVKQFCDFKTIAVPTPGGPGGISWRGAMVGMVTGGNELLYGMDLSQLVEVSSAIDCESEFRPIYDPKGLLKIYGRPLTVVAA